MAETLSAVPTALHAHAPFRVARVEKAAAPDGSGDTGWYRYVLDNGRSIITGQRRGSQKEVAAYAARCAEQINARGFGKQSLWSPRGRKPAGSTPPNNSAA
jgi:hypothetical protein